MAPALNLPPPVQSSEGNDALPVKSKQVTIEDVDEVTAASSEAAQAAKASTSKYASSGGIIYPPPDIRITIDRTAVFVGRHGDRFEAKIKADEQSNPKFAFLKEDDAYHAYYQHRIEAVKNGETDTASGAAPAVTEQQIVGTGQEAASNDEKGKPKEPEPFVFSADLPNITAVDLDVIKLTALFTARRGRSFATSLQAREGRSFQFEFLRPSHSLYGLFNRLVEQYKLVMEPPAGIAEQMRDEAFEAGSSTKLRVGPGKGGMRQKILEQARERAEWEQWQRERRKQQEDEEEKQKAAFAEIDWQDFVVVGTVELTETDGHIDLPPPLSIREMESMTLAQKRLAAMIMDGEGGEDLDAGGARRGGIPDFAGTGQAAQAGAAKAAPVGGEEDADDMEMDVSDEEDAAPLTIQRADGSARVKIRKDYVPKTLAERNAANAASATTVCPVCGLTVPVDGMAEHVRVELLNPRFQAQRAELESKKAQHAALHDGANPSRYLRQIAGARPDIFGSQNEEEALRKREEEERQKAKEREKLVWDGHAASRNVTRDGIINSIDHEAVARENERRARLAAQNAIGPQIPGVPTGPAAMGAGAAAMSAAPTGPSYQGLPPPPPPADAFVGQKRPADGLPMGQPPAQRPFGGNDSPAAHGYPPGAYGTPPPGAPTGPRGGTPIVPGAGPEYPPEPVLPAVGTAPPPKADGSYYPEAEWMRTCPWPITLQIVLPSAANVPSADGRTVTFETLLPNTTFGTIRDRIHAEFLSSGVGVSKLKLRIHGKATTLKQNLAFWNARMDDQVVVTINK